MVIFLVAAKAKGVSIFKNISIEPEVIDLINFLNKSGAKIKFIGKRTIKIVGVKEFLNGTSKFDILIPLRFDEEYREFPFKVVSIDFSKDRKEGNLDLGQKDNKKGYVESNVFVQIMNHNRHHDGNHIVETIPYFKFFSDRNRQSVDKYEKYLQDNKMFKVLADAQTFYETFNSEEKV